MFRDNPLKAQLVAGKPVVGCWSHLSSPVAAELLALAGYDFVIIDNEHGPTSLSESTLIMMAVSTTPAVADALDRAEAGIRASGKTLGGILRPGDSLAGMVERGYGLMISASDATLLRDAALTDLKTARG